MSNHIENCDCVKCYCTKLSIFIKEGRYDEWPLIDTHTKCRNSNPIKCLMLREDLTHETKLNSASCDCHCHDGNRVLDSVEDKAESD